MLLLKGMCTLILVSVAVSIQSATDATRTSYDPGKLLAKIFNPNTTISSRQRGYGLVFEDQQDPQSSSNNGQYGLIKFEDNQQLNFEDDSQNTNNNQPLRFEVGSHNSDETERPLNDQRVTFQDSNAISNKKRRRRRKPKKGLQNHQVPNYLQGATGRPGLPQPGVVANPYPTNPAFHGPVPFRRRRRPRPSLASDALAAVTGALTSIAVYDDYQCVARLLCEAAGGGLGSSGVLNSIAGIQPLLTLLSVYNGISSSPLFVFGRAVFLGMTSQGNTGTCRYAYPQCPTDPEQLIHYLNNHNGGFFRFFNSPLPDQNLEQFYNHFGQNGVDFGQDLGQNGQLTGQDYQNQQSQGYGLYQSYQSGQGYGFQNNHIGGQRPTYGQNYGSHYGYSTYGSNNIRFKDSDAKIEKRIQNKPVKDDDSFEDNFETIWQFPDESNPSTNGQTNVYPLDDHINSDLLKFPEESQKYDDKRDYTRKGKSILFPENQHNQNAYSNKNLNTDKQINYNTGQFYQNDYKRTTRKPYYQNNYYHDSNNYKQTTVAPFDVEDYFYDYKHNFYVKKAQNQNKFNNYNTYQNQLNSYNFYNKEQSPDNYNYMNSRDKQDGTQTVYIVRGNGDPNRPEIVKVRPGQSVQ